MTQSNIIVSVIIPHWNGIDVLSECLDSLKKTNSDFFEIIVSDNASSDGSQAWVKENHPDIILVENDKNYGYAGGCNRGVNLAKGKYLLFLNNDTIQDPNWLQPLVDRLESDSSIAAVQPKILNYY
ncbi:MAG: glycosyltransferase family 2 protein, partial [Candidatus Marinimicrobia bacterium]|nr:glycosyltransferase family 2 protein [Candidatus Neomarinimicrobiota bacterium]